MGIKGKALQWLQSPLTWKDGCDFWRQDISAIGQQCKGCAGASYIRQSPIFSPPMFSGGRVVLERDYALSTDALGDFRGGIHPWQGWGYSCMALDLVFKNICFTLSDGVCIFVLYVSFLQIIDENYFCKKKKKWWTELTSDLWVTDDFSSELGAEHVWTKCWLHK